MNRVLCRVTTPGTGIYLSFLNSQHCFIDCTSELSLQLCSRSSKRALFRDRKSHAMRGGFTSFLPVQLPQDSVAVPPRFMSAKNRIHDEIQNNYLVYLCRGRLLFRSLIRWPVV